MSQTAVLILMIVLAAALFVFLRRYEHRLARQRLEETARMADAAGAHEQQVQASAARAGEAARQAQSRRAAAQAEALNAQALHRRAADIEAQAEERERSAGELAAEAERLETGERAARAAVERHERTATHLREQLSARLGRGRQRH